MLIVENAVEKKINEPVRVLFVEICKVAFRWGSHSQC